MQVIIPTSQRNKITYSSRPTSFPRLKIRLTVHPGFETTSCRFF